MCQEKETVKGTPLTINPGALLDSARCSYLLQTLRVTNDTFSLLTPANSDKGTPNTHGKFRPNLISLGYSLVLRLAEAVGHGCERMSLLSAHDSGVSGRSFAAFSISLVTETSRIARRIKGFVGVGAFSLLCLESFTTIIHPCPPRMEVGFGYGWTRVFGRSPGRSLETRHNRKQSSGVSSYSHRKAKR
jgi:hypothetical protein